MKYRIFISIVDISANLKNIDIDIDIDKESLENIDIDIDIDKEILENIDIDIDIDKEISENIDIDKISNRLEFGISNRANRRRQAAADNVKTFFTLLGGLTWQAKEFLHIVKDSNLFSAELSGLSQSPY